MGQFTDKVALVTGGGSGIGRASAQAFAREGAAVLVVDLDEGKGGETVAAIEAAGGQAAFFAADVGSEEGSREMVARAVEIFGGLHFAHNNAGTPGSPNLIEDYDPAEWEAVLRLNLTGVFLNLRYELKHMAAAGGGAIVNTASVSGLGPSPLMPAYVASKAGVIALTKVAGVDYAQRGVRVNAICPAPVRTPMIVDWIGDDPAMEKLMSEAAPMGRMAEPEEQAECAVFLCSDRASFVTGISLPVDGGMSSLLGGGAIDG